MYVSTAQRQSENLFFVYKHTLEELIECVKMILMDGIQLMTKEVTMMIILSVLIMNSLKYYVRIKNFGIHPKSIIEKPLHKF